MILFFLLYHEWPLETICRPAERRRYTQFPQYIHCYLQYRHFLPLPVTSAGADAAEVLAAPPTPPVQCPAAAALWQRLASASA